MSPIIKTLIQLVTVVFGGMAVMVVTTVCGAVISFNLFDDAPIFGRATQSGAGIVEGLFGGAIGALVGAPIWVWLGYMVSRVKKPAPNKVIPDDSTT